MQALRTNELVAEIVQCTEPSSNITILCAGQPDVSPAASQAVDDLTTVTGKRLTNNGVWPKLKSPRESFPPRG